MANADGQTEGTEGSAELEALKEQNEALTKELQVGRRERATALIESGMPYEHIKARYVGELDKVEIVTEEYLAELEKNLKSDSVFWASQIGDGDVSNLGESEGGTDPGTAAEGLSETEEEEAWNKHDKAYA